MRGELQHSALCSFSHLCPLTQIVSLAAVVYHRREERVPRSSRRGTPVQDTLVALALSRRQEIPRQCMYVYTFVVVPPFDKYRVVGIQFSYGNVMGWIRRETRIHPIIFP